jgi:hypothetical protein
MAEFNQNAATVERARAYMSDVRAGHVPLADESPPFLTLIGYLGVLLDVIDGTGDTPALRMAARAVLSSCRPPGNCAATVKKSSRRRSGLRG